jgi:hypothetical protein
MKQDRIIPIFRCQVIDTIVSQYCGYWSSAGVISYSTSVSESQSCWRPGSAGQPGPTERSSWACIQVKPRSAQLCHTLYSCLWVLLKMSMSLQAGVFRVKNKLLTKVPTIEPRINACSEPLSLGLFLTCMGEGIFSFYAGQTHIIMLHGKLQFIYMKRKNSYLEWWLLVCSCESPSLLVSCPKSTAPF